MAWEKKVWVDNQTPLCAENMNHLEDGIDSKVDKSTNTKVLTLEDICIQNYLVLETIVQIKNMSTIAFKTCQPILMLIVIIN